MDVSADFVFIALAQCNAVGFMLSVSHLSYTFKPP